MIGNDRVRHCASCKKDVHDLSAMTREEIDAFLDRAASTGPTPCVSLFQRADGTILTADCPVGVRRRRIRGLLAVTLGAGAMAVIGFTALALLQSPTVSTCAPRTLTVTPVAVPVTRIADTGIYGYVAVDAPAGARIFEGEELLGTAPLHLTTSVGTHVFRMEHATGPVTASAVVHNREIAHVTFVSPQVTQIARMAGGIGPPPRVAPPPRKVPAPPSSDESMKRARELLEGANAKGAL